jgi:Uma2 family endonuclease
MPATLIESEIVPVAPARKRWTREECQILEAQGLVEPGRYELLNGDLIFKVKNRPHVLTSRILIDLFKEVFGKDRVNSEAPIDLRPGDNPKNALEPALVVLRRSDLEITNSNPQPSDVALLIEVSDATLYTDLREKAILYARAGISDYWVADLNGRRLIIHREPGEDGYGSVVVYGLTEYVSPLEKPDASIRVEDLFWIPKA